MSVSDATFHHRSRMKSPNKDVSAALPKFKLTGLLIDESGWVKKGNKSVGARHQYCGNVGKTANSQVAVFACLSNGKYASLIDTKLYLPKDWCNDIERCDEAGIPKSGIRFKTKLELAMEIIEHQQQMWIDFDYAAADRFYGNDMNFARTLDNKGLTYMLDIHSDQKIYTEKPELYLPERKKQQMTVAETFKSNNG
jgi:SRSO17 transposase